MNKYNNKNNSTGHRLWLRVSVYVCVCVSVHVCAHEHMNDLCAMAQR